MTDKPTKREQLIKELEKAGTIKNISKRETRNTGLFKERAPLKIETTHKGYGFDILNAKYPSLQIENMYADEDKITVFVSVTHHTQ